jgi:glycerophosphoryl diester phosphodiesterase
MSVHTPESLRAGLDELLADRGAPLVVAHRGTTLGSFPDNTVRSAIGALRSGADVIETDVIRSADGEYFLFHTGYEGKLFGEDGDVRQMTSRELERAVFRWQGGRSAPGVERLDTLLDELPETWINIDRSWSLWPDLLDHLARRGVEDRVLLKSPPRDVHLRALAAHPKPFLYFPIVRTQEEDDFAAPEAVAEIATRYPLVVLNALNLENGSVLYLGADDNTSVIEDPDRGWGRLVDVGASAIQTDWPHLLRDYLSTRGRR